MVRVREFKEEDLPILVEIINLANKNSYEFIPYTVESFKEEISERNLKILVAEEESEIRGLAAYSAGVWGEEIEILCVDPKIKSKTEIEDVLLEEIEKLVRGEKFFIFLDAEGLDVEKWTRRGYRIEGGLYHMVAELDSVKPLPPVPEGFVLRSLRKGEEEEMVETINRAYGKERVSRSSIERWRKDDSLFNEEWIHVADFEGKIVSVVVSRRGLEYNRYFKAKRGYLGPAGTLPEFRGKGLASALTRRAMNFLYEKGMDSVALYTSENNAASIALLRKLGFKIRHNWKFLYKYK